jgi:hypothetical protein
MPFAMSLAKLWQLATVVWYVNFVEFFCM